MKQRLAMASVCMAVLTTLSWGCASTNPYRATELTRYIEEQQFVAFKLPRTQDGVGTIIDFKDGYESVVASPDPPESQCLTAEVAARSGFPVAALTTEYTVDSAANLDLDLGRAAFAELDLATALKANRVKSVKIRLVEPFVERMTRLSAMTYIESLTEDDPCATFFLDGENLVINSVLGAQGVEYTLQDERGVALTLDADVLEDVGLEGGAHSNFEGKQSIVIDGPILIGYRAWRATQVPGLAGTPIRLEALPAKVIVHQREESAAD